MYADGDGLYLQVRPGSKTWVFRYMRQKKAHTMGLGPVALVSLAEARDKAHAARKLLQQGIDPIQLRRTHQARPDTPTFSEAAETYIELQHPTWRNEKHASQWTNTLNSYAGPVIGSLRVNEINTEHVLQVLQPIWHQKPETASRVRGRIERILDWARTRGYREGENPARWAGHLQHSLPPRRRIQQVTHHPSLPWEQLPKFCEELARQPGLTTRALLFTILTATRTTEVRGARWSEFDLESEVPLWTIPSDRMKARRPHRVPLAPVVVELLNTLPRFNSDYLFEGRLGKPLSQAAMLMVLKRMGRTDVTVHGFRATFRNWCAEQTAFPREIAEAALAHVNRDRVEAAYLRSDLFERRYHLMEAWAEFVLRPSAAAAALAIPAAESAV